MNDSMVIDKLIEPFEPRVDIDRKSRLLEAERLTGLYRDIARQYKILESITLDSALEHQGISVIIPINSARSKSEHNRIPITLHTLEALKAQTDRSDNGISIEIIILADFGLNLSDQRILLNRALDLQLPVRFVNVSNCSAEHRTAAHSRNVALLNLSSEELGVPILFIDSDSIPAPNMIPVLFKKIAKGAALVGPKVIRATEYIGTSDVALRYFHKYGKQKSSVLDIAKMFKIGSRMNFGLMVALGNNAFPSANGLMVHPTLARILRNKFGKLFLYTPAGEDLLLTILVSLSQIGPILRTDDTLILDQNRKKNDNIKDGIFDQQFHWAKHHSELWGLLTQLNMVNHGLNIFTFGAKSITEYNIPFNYSGTLVHPKEWRKFKALFSAKHHLVAQLSSVYKQHLDHCFSFLDHIFAIYKLFGSISCSPKVWDLPFRIIHEKEFDPVVHRWRDDVSLLARIIGSHAGNSCVNTLFKHKTFFFCQRQAVDRVVHRRV
ncbi:hypothetical protein GF406_06425 [candidate division KSB1 bacterium]|nr:hypothetical protein [candidate division KSB1 bacterium]